MKKLSENIIKVKRFDVIKQEDNTYIVKCDCKICMFVHTNGLNKDFKDILRFLIRYEEGSIQKVNFLFSICNDNHYEIYIYDKYCGSIIIPKSYKQKPKDFLIEMLYSIYNIKIISV